jgi:hypothetical protein
MASHFMGTFSWESPPTTWREELGMLGFGVGNLDMEV